jgi:hypothetical protein
MWRRTWALILMASLAACSSANPGLTDAERQSLLDSCVASSASGRSAFPSSACDRIVEVIADDAKNFGCGYESAQRLLGAALADDKPAVRRIERAC